MRLLKKIIRLSLTGLGAFFLLLLILAFTTLPFKAWYRLGTSMAGIRSVPACIVIMGSGGFPDEANLLRAHYGIRAARSFPSARVLVALPGDTSSSGSSVSRFRRYLIEQGIDSTRILLESHGTNTRAQVLNIAGNFSAVTPILIITSTEHLKRSVLCFQKAGFRNVSAVPTLEHAIESPLGFNDTALGGKRIPGTSIGDNLQVRYHFWTQLKYEILVIREYSALGYYSVRGWI